MIRVNVPATSANMGPGFDCLGVALGLYNRIEVDRRKEGLLIENLGKDAEVLPVDETHMVYQSMKRVYDEVGEPLKGLHIRVFNEIPVSRGLGSSAACIVGGMMAANELLNQPLDREKILELSVEVEGHPDNVTPALLGGVVVSTKGDGKTAYLQFPISPKLEWTIAVPNVSLSTKEARLALPKVVPFENAVKNVGNASLLVASLLTEDFSVLNSALRDCLHQPYRSKLLPELDYIFTEAQKKQVNQLYLSGAGPTLAYLNWQEKDEGREAFLRLLKKTTEIWGRKWDILTLKGDNKGAEIM